MSAWDIYKSRLDSFGGSKRGSRLQHGAQMIQSKLPDSMSYQSVTISGVPRDIAIIDSDNTDTKKICTLPGENFVHGGIVDWNGFHWLITEKNANNELYTKGKMRQCNYLLRWVAHDGTIAERWCIIEDGTKYLTGEYGDNQYIITRGDSRISLIIAKDPYTIRLNRENRFIIDDYASDKPLAYRLSKPFKLGGSYDNNGVLYYVLQECNTEDSDNLQLHIANYYEHFPIDNGSDVGAEEPQNSDSGNSESGRRVWL